MNVSISGKQIHAPACRKYTSTCCRKIVIIYTRQNNNKKMFIQCDFQVHESEHKSGERAVAREREKNSIIFLYYHNISFHPYVRSRKSLIIFSLFPSFYFHQNNTIPTTDQTLSPLQSMVIRPLNLDEKRRGILT
jgi:hypothetical protein